MNKQSRKVLLGAATLAAVAGAGHDAYAAKTAAVSINAKIVNAISVATTATLNFGTLSYTAAGTLQVKTDDSTAVTGGVTVIGSNAQAGGFSLKGANGLVGVITMTGSATIKNTGSASSMKVNNFRFGAASVTSGAFSLALTGGTQTGNAIGGTLVVAGTEAAGSYTGTKVITASYQ